MKMIPGQMKSKNYNKPNDPGKSIASAAAAKTITDGVSLDTGYKSMSAKGPMSPNANANSRNC